MTPLTKAGVFLAIALPEESLLLSHRLYAAIRETERKKPSRPGSRLILLVREHGSPTPTRTTKSNVGSSVTKLAQPGAQHQCSGTSYWEITINNPSKAG